MNKAYHVFEKLAISNKLLEKVISNKAYELLAGSKQVYTLADHADALVKLPISLWERGGYVKKMHELSTTLEKTKKLSSRMSRTMNTISKHQPSFFNDTTRYIENIGEEANKNLDKVNTIVDKLSRDSREKIRLLMDNYKN